MCRPILSALKLFAVIALFGASLSTYSVPAVAWGMQSDVAKPTEQDVAAQLAREGKYDEALAILDRLQEKDPGNLGLLRDRVATTSWAGQHEKAISLYETMSSQQPDYVLAAAAHSYRVLNNNEKALATYRLGRDAYPENVIFVEGEVRCLIDNGELDSAMARTQTDLRTHGHRPQIDALLPDIHQALSRRERDRAVLRAREGRYVDALSTLKKLHEENPQDFDLARDYLAVQSWAGENSADIIALYKTLPGNDEPDFVLAAVGQAYRQLEQPAAARAVYEQGLQKYPDSVLFAEGSIRSLVDQKLYKAALDEVTTDISLHGQRPEMLDLKKNIQRLMKETNKTKKKAKKSKHTTKHHG